MTHRRLPLALSLVAGALIAALPARAEHGGPPRIGLELHAHVHDVLRELGRVPLRIHARHRAHLDVFLGGSSYYAPHRHHHATYSFPVWVNGVVVHRPYVYCGEALFGSPHVRLELWHGDPRPPVGHYRGHHGDDRRHYDRHRDGYDHRDSARGWRDRGRDERRGYGYWSGHREHHDREHHYREHGDKHHDRDQWRGRGRDRRDGDHRDRDRRGRGGRHD